MDERILIPLDGSRIGEAALPYVEGLVSKLSPRVKVELTLLQIVSLLTHYVAAGEAAVPIVYTEREMEQIQQQARSYLNKVGGNIKSKKVTVKIRVEIGNAVEEIIKVADEINANWIAMSTHGRSGLGRWAFGSVTDRVLRGGNKPMLMVRAPRDIAKT